MNEMFKKTFIGFGRLLGYAIIVLLHAIPCTLCFVTGAIHDTLNNCFEYEL